MNMKCHAFARRLLLGMLCALPLSASAEVVKDIRVQGNERIDAAAVETYLGINRGDDVSRYDLDLGLKKLYDTGFFADVSLALDGGILTVDTDENPSVNDVIFEGNNQIDKEDLENEITLKSRSIYTRPKVQNDLKRLLDVYRRSGRYSAEITPQVIPLDQNRVNLVYDINEGPKALIQKITFIGNDSYDTATLESVISSTSERWYQFLSDSDKYDPDRLQFDQEKLRKFYFENGYADYKIKSAIAELSPQRDAFYLTFTMEEGPQYTFGTVDVATKLPEGRVPNLKEAIGTKEGELYDATEIEDSIDRMVDKLGDAGFAFVDIMPDTVRRPGNEKVIDLTYNISEGPKVYVERINIFGNMRTLDDVIRREFRLSEGDAYSSSKLKRTEQRLNNLGYFEKVTIQPTQGSAPDKTELDVEVQEKSTGEVTFGAGFSTVDGALADVGIRERNFLGRGQEVRARGLFAQRRQQFDIGFTEPYFLGRDLSAGFDLYKTTQDYMDQSSFDREAIGGVLRLGYNLGEKTKHQLRYAFEQSEVTNVQADASRFIRDQEGKYTTSIIGHSLIYDDLDSRFNPTKGYYLRANQDLAGLGGDGRFIRHEIMSEYYYPVAKKWTFLGAGQLGHMVGLGRDIPINQRFFIGSKEIRGFANSGLGARDITTNDALGGNMFYAATAELRFPLGLPDDLGVTGAAFTDIGSQWDLDTTGPEVRDSSNPRASAGVGVAWSSPFGPIRVDIAKAFLKEDYDEEELVRFSFGTRF
ncbi:MAG: outer membrane protein assembly factor BamA [Azospirillum brasilense]|nr:MAG: outer membrane protein assembly factor BamA [Azospirillum brasilense]